MGLAGEMIVIQAEAGAHQAQRQHQKTVVIRPDRGVIVDRQGHPLALNVEVHLSMPTLVLFRSPMMSHRKWDPFWECRWNDFGIFFRGNNPMCG